MKKDNRGISLVELIVTIAVAVIVGAAILGFIMTSTNQYRNANSEVNLQYEAQLTMNQIGDLLVNATNGINYMEVSSDEKNLFIYNKSTDDSGTVSRIVTKIGWKSADNRLYYSTYDYVQNADGTTSLNPVLENQLMSEYITAFGADTSKLDGSNEVNVSLGLALGGKSYDTDNTFTVRNDIRKVATADQAFEPDGTEDLIANVVDVTVSPATVYQQQGTTGAAFNATVIGTNHPIQDVEWSIPETTVLTDAYDAVNNPAGTRIDAGTGAVTIGAAETCETIEVQALSVQSKNNAGGAASGYKAGKAYVYNKYVEHIQLGDITATTDLHATGILTISGKNFENSDDYSGGVTFTVQKGTQTLDDVSCTVGAGTVSGNSESIPVTFSTQKKEYAGETLTVTARYGTYSVSGNIVFTNKTLENIEVQVKNADNGWDSYTSASCKAQRGETLQLRVQLSYSDGSVNKVYQGSDEWNKLTWKTIKNNQEFDDYGAVDTITSAGTFTVNGTLDYQLEYTFYIEAEYKDGEDTFTSRALLSVEKVSFRLTNEEGTIAFSGENKCTTFPDGYPVVVKTTNTIYFEVSGVTGDYRVTCNTSGGGWNVSMNGNKSVSINRNANSGASKTFTFTMTSDVATLQTSITLNSDSQNLMRKVNKFPWADYVETNDNYYIPSSNLTSGTYCFLDGSMTVISKDENTYYASVGGNTYKWTNTWTGSFWVKR